MTTHRLVVGTLFTIGFTVAVFLLTASTPTHDFTSKYLVERKGETTELTISCRGKDWAFHSKGDGYEGHGVQKDGVIYVKAKWARVEQPEYYRVLDKDVVAIQRFWLPDPLIVNRNDAEVTTEKVAGQTTQHYLVKMEYGKVREQWIHDSYPIVLGDRYYSTDAGESEDKPNLYFHAVEYKDSAQADMFEIEEPMKKADADDEFNLMPRSVF